MCPPASRAASTSKLPLTIAFGSGKTLMLKRFPGEVPCKGCPRATHLPCIDRCFISGRVNVLRGRPPATSSHALGYERHSDVTLVTFVEGQDGGALRSQEADCLVHYSRSDG